MACCATYAFTLRENVRMKLLPCPPFFFERQAGATFRCYVAGPAHDLWTSLLCGPLLAVDAQTPPLPWRRMWRIRKNVVLQSRPVASSSPQSC